MDNVATALFAHNGKSESSWFQFIGSSAEACQADKDISLFELISVPFACLLFFFLSQVSLFSFRHWEKLETEAIDLDLGATDRWTEGWLMICDKWVLVVLEDLLTHCRVDDLFWTELLVVIRNLN